MTEHQPRLRRSGRLAAGGTGRLTTGAGRPHAGAASAAQRLSLMGGTA